MRVRYSRRAEADLAAISDYLRVRNPGAARAVITTIEASIANLAHFPLMAPATDEPEMHELTIVRYPYKVYYSIEGDEVLIAHVRDARRRPWLDERR